MTAILPLVVAVLLAFVAASLTIVLIFVFTPSDTDGPDDATKWSVVALAVCIAGGMLAGLYSLPGVL